MKAFLIVLFFVALCRGASVLKEQWREQNLDGNGQFTIRWRLPENTGDIEIEMKVNCTGWASIGFIAPDQSMDDFILAGYDDATGKPYVEVGLSCCVQ